MTVEMRIAAVLGLVLTGMGLSMGIWGLASGAGKTPYIIVLIGISVVAAYIAVSAWRLRDRR